MTICPYCNNPLSEEPSGQKCPYCGERVKSPKQIEQQAESFIRYLRSKGIYHDVCMHVWSGDPEYLVNQFRAMCGKSDSAVEPVLVAKVKAAASKDNAGLTHHNDIKEIKENINYNLIPCKACGQSISRQAASCPQCGHPTGVHVCPKCGSTNTQVITNASKAVSTWLWGAFAANKVVSKYECKDCWHKF